MRLWGRGGVSHRRRGGRRSSCRRRRSTFFFFFFFNVWSYFHLNWAGADEWVVCGQCLGVLTACRRIPAHFSSRRCSKWGNWRGGNSQLTHVSPRLRKNEERRLIMLEKTDNYMVNLRKDREGNIIPTRRWEPDKSDCGCKKTERDLNIAVIFLVRMCFQVRCCS